MKIHQYSLTCEQINRLVAASYNLDSFLTHFAGPTSDWPIRITPESSVLAQALQDHRSALSRALDPARPPQEPHQSEGG